MTKINITSSPYNRAPAVEDIQPCWFANFNKNDERDNCYWTVGCQFGGKTKKFSFKFCEIKSIPYDKFSSFDFAKKLISAYREDGEEAVKSLISME